MRTHRFLARIQAMPEDRILELLQWLASEVARAIEAIPEDSQTLARSIALPQQATDLTAFLAPLRRIQTMDAGTPREPSPLMDYAGDVLRLMLYHHVATTATLDRQELQDLGALLQLARRQAEVSGDRAGDAGHDLLRVAEMVHASHVPSLAVGGLVSRDALAKLLGVDPSTISRWARRGLLDRIPRSGKQWRPADIAAHLPWLREIAAAGKAGRAI